MPRKYCKAYILKDLRQFSAWTEKREVNEPEWKDDDIVYLWDDGTVVASPVILDRGIIFEQVTPAWLEFCKTTLQFVIPEDLRYAYTSSNETQGTAEVSSHQEASL